MKSKAVFLLVIFLLHSLIGFGCVLAMGEDDHDHGDGHSHQHKHTGLVPLKEANLTATDLCCKTLVNDLVIQSKLIPESTKVQLALPVLWLSDYVYALTVPSTEVIPNHYRYADQRERPPDKDIRIAIQSFQI